MILRLYMATSVDGLITRGVDDSGWVSESDWDNFYEYIKQSDAVIMGRRTMEQFGENEFPIKGPTNIVLSSNKKLHTNTNDLIILSSTPEDIISLASQKGYKNLLLIGGSKTNEEFIKAGLIDEIIISVHPLVIGSGLSVFGTNALNCELELIDTKSVNNELVQIRYKVKK